MMKINKRGIVGTMSLSLCIVAGAYVAQAPGAESLSLGRAGQIHRTAVTKLPKG